MFTAAEFGLLLRLVLAGIDSEQNAAGQYRPDRLAAAWSRRLSPLRTVERKLRRQREALPASRSTEPRQPDPPNLDESAVAAGPDPAHRKPSRPETLSASWRSARPGGS